jgi:hypothetical protein
MRTFTDEARQRMSESAKKRWARQRAEGTAHLSEEHKRRIAEGMRLYLRSTEAERAAQRIARLEQLLAEERKRADGEAL